MHECQCLWLEVSLECIVSLGTGHQERGERGIPDLQELENKLSKVINCSKGRAEQKSI